MVPSWIGPLALPLLELVLDLLALDELVEPLHAARPIPRARQTPAAPKRCSRTAVLLTTPPSMWVVHKCQWCIGIATVYWDSDVLWAEVRPTLGYPAARPGRLIPRGAAGLRWQ